MASKLVHWEISGPDAGALKEFYGGLFGWEFQSPPGFEDYHMTSGEQTGLGGAVGKGSDAMPHYVTMYLEVADVDAHLAKIQEAGGAVVAPKTVVPEMVTFALFSDPAGNVMGLVEADG